MANHKNELNKKIVEINPKNNISNIKVEKVIELPLFKAT
jgi:hypothetical protein